MRALNVHSFSRWCETLDAALSALPEHPDWSHDLYRSIVDTFHDKPLRIVLWTQDDTPVAVIAFMRGIDADWEPVTQWLLPGFIGAVQPDRLEDVLRSIPFHSEIAWWRMGAEPPAARGRISEIDTDTTYGLACDEDFDAYWCSQHILRDVRKARDRCADLEFTIDDPEAAEWVMQKSELFWNQGHSPQADAKLIAARMLQREGKLYTASLRENGRFVCADVVLVHQHDAVSYMTYRQRDQRIARLGAGNFVLSKVFEHARERGLHYIDIGGGYDYKRKWARPMSTKSSLTIEPLIFKALRSGLTRCRVALRPVHGLTHMITG